jgi:hypothetical protein
MTPPDTTSSRKLWWVLPIWLVVVGPSWVFIAIGFDSSLIWVAVEFALLASGILILANVRMHKVGLLLFIAGATFSLAAPLFATVEVLDDRLPDVVSAVALAAGNALITIWLPLTIAAIALFPTGHWPTRKWRYPGVLIGISVGLAVLAPMLNGGFGGDNSDGDATPWSAAVAPFGDIVSSLFFLSMLVSAVVALSSVVYRFIRSEGVERQQMKWFALSVSILTLGTLLDQAILGLTAADGWRAVWIGFLVIQTLVVMAVAIIKYRIYDIDRIISRTVSYTLVVVLLGGVFAILTWLPSFIVGGMSETGLVTTPPVLVAASTLAVAALFNPLRRRVQRSVDRRFNRSRYESQQIIDDFASGLQDQTDVEDLARDLGIVVEEVLEPVSVGIWIKD